MPNVAVFGMWPTSVNVAVAPAVNGERLQVIVPFVPADGVEQFRGYFLDTFVRRAFRELDAPLSDLPDGLPTP